MLTRDVVGFVGRLHTTIATRKSNTNYHTPHTSDQQRRVAAQPLLQWRTGGLMPFHALIIMGLSLGQDPLARLFSLSPLRRVGDLSYAMFVLQCPTFRAVTMWCIGTQVDRYYVYPGILFIFAAIAHHTFSNVFMAHFRKVKFLTGDQYATE